MDEKEKRLKIIKKQGPSLCLAKWLQVTLDLEHGTNHSCHHPQRHPIDTEGLETNPSLLHNTPYKKRQRQYMIEGLRPRECSYCWEIEDQSPESLSDRLIKSTDDWAFAKLEELLASPGSDCDPSYLEVMFSSHCQLSCVYCMSDISTKVAEEMAAFGPYPVHQKEHRLPLFPKSPTPNPYIEAFWKWFPSLIQRLKYLRLTGGEPFLDGHTLRLLKELEKKPNPDLQLAINSNCSLDPKVIRAFIPLMKKLIQERKVAGLELYASIDTHGIQAEYIRHGLDYKLFLSNIELLKKEIPELKIVFMTTFNILSFENFDQLIADVLTLKNRYHNINLDVAILKNPEYLRPELAPNFMIDQLAKKIPLESFHGHERQKIETLLAFLSLTTESSLQERRRADFLRFIKEYDKRKQLYFSKVFPSLAKGLNYV